MGGESNDSRGISNGYFVGDYVQIIFIFYSRHLIAGSSAQWDTHPLWTTCYYPIKMIRSNFSIYPPKKSSGKQNSEMQNFVSWNQFAFSVCIDTADNDMWRQLPNSTATDWQAKSNQVNQNPLSRQNWFNVVDFRTSYSHPQIIGGLIWCTKMAIFSRVTPTVWEID